MADLSDPQKLALARYWPQIYGSAAGHVTTADMFDRITQRAEDLGLPSVGVGAQVISTLRSFASRMVASAERLNASDPSLPINASMLAEPPWSRSTVEQSTMPVYNVGFLHTVQNDEGETLSVWQTMVFTGGLPSTVGELQEQVAAEAQRLASEATGDSKGTPRGTSLGVSQLNIQAV